MVWRLLIYFTMKYLKQSLVAGVAGIVVGSGATTAFAGVRDHRDSAASAASSSSRSTDSSSSSGPVVRDHRDDSGPVVRDHRNDSGPVVRDHRDQPSPSSSPQPAPVDDRPDYANNNNGFANNNNYGYGYGSSSYARQDRGPHINWSRARFEIDTFMRRVNSIDSTAGVGLQLTGDITRNLYVGIEVASGLPMAGEMSTNSTFTQAGVVAGVRGTIAPTFSLGVEAALAVQEFRDVNTVVDLRIKAEKQVMSQVSLGLYGGRNVYDGNDTFAGVNLAFHSAR